ncbi:serine kinase/phosphatase [Pseudomonas sp. R5(2019)]|uniref:serine kinase/phosphatase n=1 Tax=Pseudomonas sp. R5(2019) TaxID=2697566 RepID=UPI001411E3BA|nr:serine kinase/phosphatase [Pseudomonas sp. R5(2019)]NBA94923.1 serine kinase/phosphatase [Pseudomonas sp. R5(2019)]
MTQAHRPPHSPEPAPIDDTEDRMGSIRELDFDTEEPSGRIGDLIPENELQQTIPPERVREAGMTGASTADHEPTDDDMSPETLIDEDGALSATEEGFGGPADQELSVVDANEIGGGRGLDEAELARQDPLDGKPER